LTGILRQAGLKDALHSLQQALGADRPGTGGLL